VNQLRENLTGAPSTSNVTSIAVWISERRVGVGDVGGSGGSDMLAICPVAVSAVEEIRAAI